MAQYEKEFLSALATLDCCLVEIDNNAADIETGAGKNGGDTEVTSTAVNTNTTGK